MGQTQSYASSSEGDGISQPAIQPSPSPSSSPPSALSLEALVAEATASGDDENEESLDVKAQKALECPCVAELRKGPCGTQFTEAFVCFIKSTAVEKGWKRNKVDSYPGASIYYRSLFSSWNFKWWLELNTKPKLILGDSPSPSR